TISARANPGSSWERADEVAQRPACSGGAPSRLRRGEPRQILGSFRSLGGGREDRTLVGLEHLQPVGNVSGMIGPGRYRDAEVGTEEGTGKLGDQFLHGIGFIAETVAKIAVETLFSTGPMSELMGQ